MPARKEKVLAIIYQKAMRDRLRIIDSSLINPRYGLQIIYKGASRGTYSCLVPSKDGTSIVYRIVIGGATVSSILNLPSTFHSKDTLRPYVRPIKKAIMGLNFHEISHVMISDLTFAGFADCDPNYDGLAKRLFNICEDPIADKFIIDFFERERPYDVSPRAYMEDLHQHAFYDHLAEYTDDGSLDSFLQYLLLLVRCGRKKIPNTNAVFEKYSADLVPMLKAILSEPNGTRRQVLSVDLAKWIYENVKEFDWSAVSPPEDMRMPTGKIRGDRPSPMSADGGLPSGSTSGRELADALDDTSPESEESKPESEPETEEPPGTGAPKETESDDVSGFDDCFEDLLNSSYSHEFVIAKDVYVVKNPDALQTELDAQLEQSSACIENVSKFLTLFKGRIKPRRIGGFMSGRLDIRAAMQDEARGGGSLRLFNRTLPRGRMTDLAVSLVCDNSGSMSGTKSRLASIAALALAQACEWSKVPFECSCFTKTSDCMDGTSITIIEKSFDDSFEKAKPYFAINDSCLIHMLDETIPVPTFAGNSEEVNLYHITTNLAKCGHKTKLMIVFCDGATTGSRNSLRLVLKRAKDLGIHVIGVGLMSRLDSLYEHCRNFDSYDDMRDGLAQFLVDTLSEFVTR